jgi:hypothetical protein
LKRVLAYLFQHPSVYQENIDFLEDEVVFMFRDAVIDFLKDKKSIDDKIIAKAANKIQKQKRLSSNEFLSVYDSLWKEGPKVQYQNPDARVKHFQSINRYQNP